MNSTINPKRAHGVKKRKTVVDTIDTIMHKADTKAAAAASGFPQDAAKLLLGYEGENHRMTKTAKLSLADGIGAYLSEIFRSILIDHGKQVITFGHVRDALADASLSAALTSTPSRLILPGSVTPTFFCGVPSEINGQPSRALETRSVSRQSVLSRVQSLEKGRLQRAKDRQAATAAKAQTHAQ